MTSAQAKTLQKRLGGMSSISPPPQAFRRLEEHTPVTIGDGSWQVVTGEGHSPEHACLFNAAQQVMFSGDQLLARISPNIGVHASEAEANPLHKWLHSLERIGGLPADTLVLPAHELPFYGLDIRAAQLVEHHRNVLEKLRGLCEETPGTALVLSQRLFSRRRGDIDDLLALSETLAHLAYLCANGGMVRRLDSSGVYQYEVV
jgi:glyoxylase-like metal-dependent hydrolase (beta-lactamase superfamily II)